MKVIVLGAGVVGCAVAYYLSLRGIAATVVEAVGVACAASGKSGGFLARDWCEGQPQEQLARFSFDLHADLATKLGRDYGYRRVTTYAVATSARRRTATMRHPTLSPWLDGDVAVRGRLGDPTTTAQLDPAAFTNALLDTARENGVLLRVGTVENVLLDHKRKSVVGVVVDGEQIDANVVVIAMGPWTVQAAAWLPLPVVYGSKSYSIVLRNSTNPPAEALFVEFEDESGEWHCPEVFTRADGTTYVCGFGDNAPVPDSPREVWVDEEACDRLRSVASQLSGALGNAELVHRQACYRPICHDAMPVIGNLDRISGAYIATGHNCWGMLNAPATAYALAELIADGESRTVDLKPFAPSRLALARESRS